MTEHLALRTTRVDPDCTYYRPHIEGPTVTGRDGALQVMTDLRRILAVTIGSEASIDAANDRMIAHAIRLLLVIDQAATVLGLITATDILGEKPLIHLKDSGGEWRNIKVSDIMTPREEIEALRLSDVVKARVGDIVQTLHEANRQHAIVVDDLGTSERQTVCGIFSMTQIGKQMGISIEPSSVARTFAELERVINA